MTRYWHRWERSEWGVILGLTRCEICDEIARADNLKGIKDDDPGFDKHAIHGEMQQKADTP